MRPTYRRDPAMAEDPLELQGMMKRSAGLKRGLVTGASMLLLAAALIYVGALLLQYNAQQTAQTSANSPAETDARSESIPLAPVPSPGPNPTR